jgi:hypothetical protein
MFGSLNDSSSFLKLKVGHFFIFYFINVFWKISASDFCELLVHDRFYFTKILIMSTG